MASDPDEVGPHARAVEERSGETQTLVVLFSDLCDSTRLYHDLGDAAAHAMAARFLALMGEVTARHGGRVVKTIGDGAMATFPAADMAYEAATEIQDALQGGKLQVKIGFHFGPVICADGDVFGDTVNLAARVLARSGPGEILMTGTCVAGMRADYRSNVRLLDTTGVKGRPEPIEIYRMIGDEDNVTVIVPSTRIIERRKTMVLSYNEQEVRIDTRAAPVLLGRDPGCNIVVQSEWASRRHATVEVQRDRFMLTDHSSNGTYVVPEGAAQQFLKREGVPLTGKGVVSLGLSHEHNAQHLIRYQFVTGTFLEGEGEA